MTSSSASEQIRTTLNGQNQDMVTPHRKRASLLLAEQDICVRLGCGSQGSCGSCLVVVKGRPRMSCTLRAKNIDRKIVQTLQGIPLQRREEIVQAFLAVGAGQCGYCMPGITTQVHTLLSNIEKPTEAQINKALSLHSCRCLSPHLLTRAVNTLIEANKKVQPPSTSPFYNEMLGLAHTLQDYTLPGMHTVHPLFTWDTKQTIFETDAKMPEGVRLISSTELPEKIRKAHPSLMGFLMSIDNWTLQQTLETYALGRVQAEMSAYATDSTNPNTRTLLPYDEAPLEPEVCVVSQDTIRLNGVESDSLSQRFNNYRIEQWKVGGSFGSRLFSDHVDWSVWLHEHFKVPISMRLNMAQMLKLRPKHPFVEFTHADPLSIEIRVEPATTASMCNWVQSLQQNIQQLTRLFVEALQPCNPTTPTISLSHRPERNPNIQERASEIRTAQVGALVLESLFERESEPINARLSFLDQVVQEYHLPIDWFETVQEHARLCKQNDSLGWGVCIVPSHTHTLSRSMQATLTITQDGLATITMGLPITNTLMVTTIQSLVHRLTDIPTDKIAYACIGGHPSPMDDPSTLRAHWIHAVTKLCQQYTATNKEHSDEQHYTHTHRYIEMPTSACSVLLNIDAKGTPSCTWVSLPLDEYTPMTQIQSELSGRWMRSLGREQLWHSGSTPSGLFKDLHTLKTKDSPTFSWNSIESTQPPTTWTSVNGATMAAIVNARRKNGLHHGAIPFEKNGK